MLRRTDEARFRFGQFRRAFPRSLATTTLQGLVEKKL
jgi:hypothetical protein